MFYIYCVLFVANRKASDGVYKVIKEGNEKP